MSTQNTPPRSAFPWMGGIVALLAVLVMVMASMWVWPRLAGGFEAIQRDSSARLVPGWPIAILMPALLIVVTAAVLVAQPVRRHAARRARTPLWRTDAVNKWSSTLTLAAVSLAFLGVHGLLLALAAGLEVSQVIGILAFCLGLMVIVLGIFIGRFAPLTDEQRRLFPERTRRFVDAYRDGFRRTAHRLIWPFIGIGVLTCVLAFLAPWIAVFVPALAALALCLPIGYGIAGGVTRHDTHER